MPQVRTLTGVGELQWATGHAAVTYTLGLDVNDTSGVLSAHGGLTARADLHQAANQGAGLVLHLADRTPLGVMITALDSDNGHDVTVSSLGKVPEALMGQTTQQGGSRGAEAPRRRG